MTRAKATPKNTVPVNPIGRPGNATPRGLTQDRIEKVVKLARKGLAEEFIAGQLQITPRLFNEWLSLGVNLMEKQESGEEIESDKLLFLTLARRYYEAVSQFVEQITAGMLEDADIDPKIRTFLLTSRFKAYNPTIKSKESDTKEDKPIDKPLITAQIREILKRNKADQD